MTFPDLELDHRASRLLTITLRTRPVFWGILHSIPFEIVYCNVVSFQSGHFSNEVSRAAVEDFKLAPRTSKLLFFISQEHVLDPVRENDTCQNLYLVRRNRSLCRWIDRGVLLFLQTWSSITANRNALRCRWLE